MITLYVQALILCDRCGRELRALAEDATVRLPPCLACETEAKREAFERGRYAGMEQWAAAAKGQEVKS